jgi:hypothetical protein
MIYVAVQNAHEVAFIQLEPKYYANTDTIAQVSRVATQLR